MCNIGTDIAHAAMLLREGQVVAFPTETVYGLAGNAFDSGAVAQVFQLKERPRFNPLIVHTYDLEAVEGLVTQLPPLALQLAEAFWPGPLTLLLPRRSTIPDLVTAGLPHVAIRIPNHPLTLQLLSSLAFPLVAPSANPFGYVSPTTAQHVVDQLGGQVPYVLDGGNCAVGLESTIVGFNPMGDRAIVYRLGGIPLEQLRNVVDAVEVQAKATGAPLAPGMMKRHYAPKTPFALGDVPSLFAALAHKKRVGLIVFSKTYALPAACQVVLAPDGRLETAARRLFSVLRMLDAANLDQIIAEPAPNIGLGAAINERLERAVHED